MTARWTETDLAHHVARNPKALRKNFLSPAPAVNTVSKYRNKRTEVNGIVFDSKREAHRYQDLNIMQQHGLISDLKRQVVYPLVVNGVHIASYRSDFEYIEDGQK